MRGRRPVDAWLPEELRVLRLRYHQETRRAGDNRRNESKKPFQRLLAAAEEYRTALERVTDPQGRKDKKWSA